ncbi:SDR family NAD(P)-dependent oxidoreductase, partial [Silanimonas lenta]|uniref:SDR family NAD(P)-dependent oxidoreductase n=1 Tax=Silanimonas lenta TaxID=265429 RepID=UPI002FE1DFFC
MASGPSPPKRERVLITGGGSGLGLALAQRYAADGAQVLVVDIDPVRAEAARAGLPGEGHLAFTADVGDDASMLALKQA